jgi:GT2 family glycosyltransferase
MDNSLFPDSDFCQYRYYLESKIWSFPSTNGLAKVTPDNYFFSTQNLSLSRCLFNELGKFDESLIDSVDFDLCAKAMIENVPIYYDNEVAVWHDDQGKIEDYINRQIQYHKSRRRLAKLKPEYVNIIPSQFYQGKNDVIRRFMKKVFIVNRTWFSIIDSRFYEEVIPKWIRYKIYGYLIHSTSMAKS